MARTAKPKGAAPTRSRKKKREGENSFTLDQLREYLDGVHGEIDAMEEANASARGRISKIYDRACDDLGITKNAIKFIFGKERRDRKDEAKAMKMDTGDRDALERAAAAFGDGPMADWLNTQAKREGASEE